jgi:aminoglycoside phosphotransferase (APT) family kinase protein
MEDAAESLFNLNVDEVLPIGESFSSDVLRFASNGQHWVLKRPFSIEKAQREALWLERFKALDFTPKLKSFMKHGGEGYILMESLAGLPLASLDCVSHTTLVAIGDALRKIHEVPVGDFDGHSSWRELLRHNAKRYQADLTGGKLTDVSLKALNVFEDNLKRVPDAAYACPVHFDLRPGNILVDEGKFSGIIDFESMRGGHPSMDFFKLIDSGAETNRAAVCVIERGYGHANWLQNIDELVGLYTIYHGLAGLAWCKKHGETETAFYNQNLSYIETTIKGS